MNEQLTKSLIDLVDETLHELEELRKSRFSAAEIKIEGPGAGIDGKPSDGDLHAKAEDEEHDDEDEEHEEEEKEEVSKKEDDEDEEHEEHEEEEKEEVSKKEDDKEPHKEDPKHEEKEKKLAQKLLDMHKGEMKKSSDEMSTLMKSYVEERIKPLETQLSTILELVNKIADQPVAPKGATIKSAPLFKSFDGEHIEALSKAEVASKLFELKKSGTAVDTLDIAKADLGQDLEQITKKYKLS